MLTNNEILANYTYLKKLEQVIPLKKAEIEAELWKNIYKELKITFKDVKCCEEKELEKETLEKLKNRLLSYGNVGIISFELSKKLEFKIGRNKNKGDSNDKFYIFIKPINNLSQKEWDKLAEHGKEKKWKVNQPHEILKDISNKKVFNDIFSFHDEKFYNLLEDDTFKVITNVIIETIKNEIENFEVSSLQF